MSTFLYISSYVSDCEVHGKDVQLKYKEFFNNKVRVVTRIHSCIVVCLYLDDNYAYISKELFHISKQRQRVLCFKVSQCLKCI